MQSRGRLLGALAGTLFLGLGPALGQTNPFGPNVYLITPSMSASSIETELTNLSNEGQFSSNRYSILFAPGTYSILAPVGYYEQIAGVGPTPASVTINGFLTPNYGSNSPGANTTTYFWRSMENLTVNAATDTAQSGPANTLQWGVSQAAPLRRMQINGGLELTNSYCGEASGGFTSDTVVTGNVNSCSQQQWYTRNSNIGSWSGSVWNMVFSGVIGAPAQSFPNPPYTLLPSTPASREKPFLYLDSSNNWNVFVPSLKTNSSGVSWTSTNMGPGTSLAISKFFIATPSSTLAQINSALSSGQNLVLTPGIYQYSGAINVTNANTVILGMGYANLVPQTGSAAITVADVDGVVISGLMVDAGPTNSPVLMQMGVAGGARASHATNPSALQDITVRIGGAELGKVTTAIEIDSNNVVIDNLWSWRADHGNAGTTGWTVNTANHGLVVNGDNVLATGLAVEHYQQQQVLWNGNGGETIFFQSEMPYDPPSQSAWMNGSANGYPSYAISNSVSTHTAYGLGIYSYFDQGVNIVSDSAITAPVTQGVLLTDMVTDALSGSGQITHVVNATGPTASTSSSGTPEYLVSFGGQACTSNCVAPPAAPSGLSATAASSTMINLAWTASSTSGVTYTVYRSTTSGFAPASGTQIATGLSATNFSDSSLTAGTTYYYLVEASTSAGNSTASNQATATTQAAGKPNAPANVAATAVSTSQINLAWTASTTSGVTYDVYRSTTSGFTPSASTQIGTTSGSSYSDTALAASTTYYYVLEANNSTGNSAPSNQASATTLSPAGPAAPTSLIASAASSSQINLSWTASSTSGVTYSLFRSTTAGFSASSSTQIKTGITGTTYSDTGLTASTTYYYLVEAVNSAGSSAPSNSASAATSGVTGGTGSVQINSGGSVSGAWAADEDFSGGGTYSVTATINTSGLTNPAPQAVYQSARQGAFTYTVPGLTAGATYNVNLHFAELYFTTSGSRQFNVSINSTQVLMNFDIVAAAGAGDKAVVKTFSATANSSGQIVIAFSNGAHDQPMFNGLDIEPVSTAASLQIDSGGAASSSWSADVDYSGGGTYSVTAAINTSLVTNAPPQAVLQSARQGAFTYTIPGFNAGSTHTVNLYFAELYFTAAGKREFNASINGASVLTNFDIYAAAGAADKVVQKSFTATANSSGQIVIQFSNGAVDQAMLNALSVQ